MDAIELASGRLLGDRFSLGRCLGSGADSSVYEAYDHRLGCAIALKIPHRADAESLIRLKREFRALSEVAHPNLVTLHELLSVGGHWMLSMELIEGSHITDYARAAVPGDGRAMALRDVLRQLVAGLGAIHQRGLVHRDIKPSNILVDRNGRVVLLDFGVSEACRDVSDELAGTPGYLAPELLLGAAPTSASDWYSVGVVLYQALTGVRPPAPPLSTTAFQPAPPSTVNPDTPPDLDALCASLLRADPRARPSRAEIEATLSINNRRAATSDSCVSAPGREQIFVGRERALRQLFDAYGELEQGHAVACFVRGASGMGKSALVERFLERIGRASDAVVLRGRCYPRAAVPHPALDAMVDALARYLRELPRSRADILVPRNAHALACLFPVLGSIPSIADAPARSSQPSQPQEQRRRGLRALRELLARLAETHPVVIVIDDLQWGDGASAPFLTSLTVGNDAPSLLLVGCYRSEDAATSPLVDALESDGDPARRRIDVGPLAPASANELARGLLARLDLPTADGALLARDAEGSPFFLRQLVQHAAEQAVDTPRLEKPLDRVLIRRLRALGDDTRRALELVAIAGGPAPRDVLDRGLGLDASRCEATWQVLDVARWVRRTGRGRDEHIECAHDRVRVAILSNVSNQRRANLHGTLARSLEPRASTAPAELVEHYRAAGRLDDAALHARRGADRAARALAFDAAARLRAIALELHGVAHPDYDEQMRALADDYANAGRAPEAAKILETLADLTCTGDTQSLRRRACELLLTSGHTARGSELLDELLEESGLARPRSGAEALARALSSRVRRSLRSSRRDGPADLHAIDLCWAAAFGLGGTDVLSAVFYQQEFLRRARAARNPRRIARALLLGAFFASASGSGRGYRRGRAALLEAQDIAKRLGDPGLMGFTITVRGAFALHEGRHDRALTHSLRAEELLRTRCTGVQWELSYAVQLGAMVRVSLGRWSELGRLVPEMVGDAESRGDRLLAARLRRIAGFKIALMRDDVHQARCELASAGPGAPRGSADVEFIWEQLARAELAIYAGKPHDSLRALAHLDSVTGRAVLSAAQLIRIMTINARAVASLATAAPGAADARHVERLAAASAARLERESHPLGPARGLAIRGVLAARDGDAASAMALFDESWRSFVALGAEFDAAAVQLRMGQLAGGEGHLRQAESWMRAQGIRSCERAARTLIPEL